MSEEKKASFEKMGQYFEKYIKELAGTNNVQRFELIGLIRKLGNIYDAIFNQSSGDSELSGPRLAILMRLYIDDQIGNSKWITPTILSHFQNVSKNTISSLLRGLEDQGLLQRENDPIDRRIYRLKITEAGRELVKEFAPRQVEYMNSLSSDLTDEETEQLIVLLKKLLQSLQTHAALLRHKSHRE
ncbi:MAG: MarR family transcriptional regulator [Bacillota bacterium]